MAKAEGGSPYQTLDCIIIIFAWWKNGHLSTTDSCSAWLLIELSLCKKLCIWQHFKNL